MQLIFMITSYPVGVAVPAGMKGDFLIWQNFRIVINDQGLQAIVPHGINAQGGCIPVMKFSMHPTMQ